MRHTRLAPLALLALLALAACGNDPRRQGTFAVAQSVAASTVGPLLGLRGEQPAPAAGTPAEIAAILPQLPAGPVLRFEVPKVEQSAIAFVAGSNGGSTTFATVTGQTITTRAQVVTATRGFAWDIMSSATNGATDLIRGRRSGTVDRIYRYLDTSDDEVETVARCAIAPAGGETITLASGDRYATTRMRESCTTPGGSFTNLYWVTAGGAIPRSHQWISPEVGLIEIEVIRN